MFNLRLIPLLALGCITVSPAQEVNRTKVTPRFTEGVRMEGSSIFTYVDEKKRRRLTAEVIRPENAETPTPAIVMFFGGGWQNGRPGLFVPLAQRLAQLGFACVIPNYRLSGEAPFPAAAHDGKAAIRWTRKNARRFHIDPERIACIGGSAGGHLSGFMAATNGMERFEGRGEHQDQGSEVQAAIVMCGPMNLLDPKMVEGIEKAKDSPSGHAVIDFMAGTVPSEDDSLYREASPLTHIGSHTPPMLFIDGEFDRPRERYLEFWERMDVHAIPHEFVLMPKGPHPFWGQEEWFEPTAQAVAAFLRKHLPKP